VGIIEITSARPSLSAMLTKAQQVGGQVGCDVVVDRQIHRVSLGVPSGRVVATVGVWAQSAPPPPESSGNAIPPSRREFVCGVFDAHH
jgi:hypothetical protein